MLDLLLALSFALFVCSLIWFISSAISFWRFVRGTPGREAAAVDLASAELNVLGLLPASSHQPRNAQNAASRGERGAAGEALRGRS